MSNDAKALRTVRFALTVNLPANQDENQLLAMSNDVLQELNVQDIVAEALTKAGIDFVISDEYDAEPGDALRRYVESMEEVTLTPMVTHIRALERHRKTLRVSDEANDALGELLPILKKVVGEGSLPKP